MKNSTLKPWEKSKTERALRLKMQQKKESDTKYSTNTLTKEGNKNV